MVEEKEVAVVVISFVFIPSSLFSFDLLFVAFDSSSFCGGSGADVAVIVVEVDVVVVVVVAFCGATVLPSSSFFFGTELVSASFAAAASLNFLHSLRCPPCFQWCT